MLGQNTTIPDTNFEQALIFLGLDVAPDGQVLTANIDTVTTLYIQNKNITDLTGIEDFTLLVNLHCSSNQLSSLDVSQNLFLEKLLCNNNQITNLDVTQNAALIELWCGQNQLTSLNVTQNLALCSLYCATNPIGTLDISQNILLKDLSCFSNQLTSLNVSSNPDLWGLAMDYNPISSIDVTQNPELKYLSCSTCSLTTIDVSQNDSLTNLNCALNQLTFLDVRNGNNVNFTYFTSQINPNLNCIYVDDKNGAYLSSWTKDVGANWVNDSIDCLALNLSETSSFNSINVSPNPSSSYFTIEGLNKLYNLTIFNVLGHLLYTEKNVLASSKRLDVSKYSKGLLFIRIESEREVYYYKLIKE